MTSAAMPPPSSDPASGRRVTAPGPGGHVVVGETEVLPVVVEKVAALAATEIAGVVRLGGGGTWGALRRGVSGGSPTGVAVELDAGTAAVTVQVEIEYGVAARDLMRTVRDHVAAVVEELAGVGVARVDVTVTDVHTPGEIPTGA